MVGRRHWFGQSGGLGGLGEGGRDRLLPLLMRETEAQTRKRGEILCHNFQAGMSETAKGLRRVRLVSLGLTKKKEIN